MLNQRRWFGAEAEYVQLRSERIDASRLRNTMLRIDREKEKADTYARMIGWIVLGMVMAMLAGTTTHWLVQSLTQDRKSLINSLPKAWQTARHITIAPTIHQVSSICLLIFVLFVVGHLRPNVGMIRSCAAMGVAAAAGVLIEAYSRVPLIEGERWIHRNSILTTLDETNLIS